MHGECKPIVVEVEHLVIEVVNLELIRQGDKIRHQKHKEALQRR